MAGDVCTNCGATEMELVNGKEQILVKGEPIEVQFNYYRCPDCGEEVLTPSLQPDPLESAYRIYRKRHGLLQPEEITEWRKSYKLTQKELAGILGIGTATLSRYEKGSLQDEAQDKLLRLAMKPDNLARLVDESENVLSVSKKRALLQQIAEMQADSHPFDSFIRNVMANYAPDVYSGYRQLDWEKLSNAILYFAQKGVWKTKLNKLLFYADFKHFQEFTTSITGMKYVRLPYGPIPNNYESYYAALSFDKAIDLVEESHEEWGGVKVRSVKSPDISVFSPSELRVLAETIEHFDSFTAGRISELSHNEPGYIKTEENAPISYEYSEELIGFSSSN
ncbi:MAG: DUF4065 domain-containing protein [Dehalococcoidia bacterium]